MTKIIISSKGFNRSKTFLISLGNGQPICSGSVETISAYMADKYPDEAKAIVDHSRFTGELPSSVKLMVEPSEEFKISGAISRLI